MDKELAEKYALEAFKWLSINNGYLEAFLSYSGSNYHSLRNSAKDPKFLCYVLEFFMTTDSQVIDLSSHLNIKPEQIALASRVLSDEKLPNWT